MNAPSPRDPRTPPTGRHPASREWRWIAAVAALFAVGYGVTSLTRHWHFGSNVDLAIFDQAIWHLSRFEAPASTVRGFANILGDHFHPVLTLLAPLYWIAPAPETLLVAQAVLLGASVLPVFAFVRSRLSFGVSIALCAAYGLFWGMQRTALSDVHEMAFAPLFVAGAILALDRRRWGWVWTTSIGLMLVKEDLIPLVAVFGAVVMWRGARGHGLALLVVGLTGFVTVVRVIIPWFSGLGDWSYGGAFEQVFARPWTAPAVLVTPPQKLVTLLCWLGPFLFLPLLSSYGLLLVPVMLERLLSSDVRHFGTGFHYSAPLAPILVMAASDGLARVQKWLGTGRVVVVRVMVAVIVIACALVPGHQPLLRLARARQYAPRPYRATAMRALAVIPPDASVVAQSALTPWLSQRTEIYLLTPGAPPAQYVIASADLDAWPNPSFETIERFVAERRALGDAVVFEEAGWIVLKRD